jgi:cytochrome c oxidase subunit 2
MIDTSVPLQQSGSWRAQSEVFSEIFGVFVTIGTIVGIVVIAYTLYHGYKYRDSGDEEAESGFDAPQLGELPTGQQSGKSRKLFMSFGLSAIIVISVVVYSYTLLLYVEEGPSNDIDTNGGDELTVEVTGIQFAWLFEYPNDQQSSATMRVPADATIRLQVTSDDVWHAFGVTELRVKADAIPGETSTTWFTTDEPGTYKVQCFELCGSAHSQMVGEIQVMEQDEFNEWYEGTYEGASSQATQEVAS